MALTGRAALVALAGVVPIVLAPSGLTVLAWVLLLAVLVGVDLALAGSPRALRLDREPLPTVRLGEQVTAALVVGNAGRRGVRGLLRDGWSPSTGDTVRRHRLHVPAGQQRRVVTTLRPTRRGDRRTDRVTVRSLGPLGVAARQVSLPAPGVLRVLPAFAARRHLPGKLARLRELDGLVSAAVRGQGTEFDSLRDYVEGDDVRSIDWRATARRHAGQATVSPVVRTWRPERDRRLLLVLDPSRTAAARVGDAPRLDAAMDAALLLAALAARAGDRVDLLAMDRRVRARVEGVGRSSLLPALVSAMAPLEADLVEADWTALSGAVLRQLSRRALVVLLTTVDSAAVADELLPVLPLLTARHQVVVASVTDPTVDALARGRGDAYAVYGAAAAERALLERTAVTAELERVGVEVVEGSPEQLPPRLADRYLALKAAGRL
ncbi:MAG TPA: DUF58 domain-containing protein [Kineosporiaceae bacterium]|nr:DUF58 domain-containing protein [Kineosporiaceae bacterium]